MTVSGIRGLTGQHAPRTVAEELKNANAIVVELLVDQLLTAVLATKPKLKPVTQTHVSPTNGVAGDHTPLVTPSAAEGINLDFRTVKTTVETLLITLTA